jgi:AbrB family looped-hinge helix DNA binding protein
MVASAGKSTVNERGGVQVPAAVREALQIEGGDKLRWVVDEDGELTVEVIHQRAGAFEDFEPGSSDEPTNAVELEKYHGLE